MDGTIHQRGTSTEGLEIQRKLEWWAMLPQISRRYEVGDPETARLLDELLDHVNPLHEREWIREVLVTAIKLVQDGAATRDIKLLRTAVKEMRHGFRVFSQYRHVRKVSVFGSARTRPEEPDYRLAEELGRRLAAAGYMVITGAGPGIMEAAHRGAGAACSIGLNIRLPFEQAANPVIADDPKLINFRYFFTRKLFFVKETDAIVLLPGGFGTMDEGFETLTLLQTGRSVPKPVVMLESDQRRYWSAWLDFVRTCMLDRGLISPEDLALFRLAGSAEEACREIQTFYRRFHSLRYVEENRALVIRLRSPLPPGRLDELNREFADILVEGRITATPPLEEESNEPELEFLPRLKLAFDSYHFGRLRQMIDAINR